MMTRRFAVGALLVAACGAQNLGLREVEGGLEMGLRRGAAWSVLTVRPPHVIGPRVNLRFGKDGMLLGQIDGRMVNFKITEDEISGMSPLGAVAITLEDRDQVLFVEGTWNGQRVRFEITEDQFHGRIVGQIGGGPRSGIACQFVINQLVGPGVRTGTSICTGLPEDTRLEIPPKLEAWLTRAELVTVVLTLLSTMPLTAMEF